MIPVIIKKAEDATAKTNWTKAVKNTVGKVVGGGSKLMPRISTGALLGGLAGVGMLGTAIGGRNSRALLSTMKDGAIEVGGIPKSIREARALRRATSAVPGVITSTAPGVASAQLDLQLLNRFAQPGGYLSRSQYAYLKARKLIP